MDGISRIGFWKAGSGSPVSGTTAMLALTALILLREYYARD